VIGAGGLGSPLIQYLGVAGIGAIGIVDDVVVSLPNLQRQVIHGTSAVGCLKVESAANVVGRLNPHVMTEAYPIRLTPAYARSIISRYDIVADASDNLDTRSTVSDAYSMENKPLVTAALGQFDGSLTTIRAHESGPDGRLNPVYRCLFPSPLCGAQFPTYAEAGVLSALAGIMGSLMTMEVIREIVGFGEGLVERLLMVDLRSMRFDTVRYLWDETNPLSGRQRRALHVQDQVNGKGGHR
jgi:adenylyltransferase/sulfurtransferase